MLGSWEEVNGRKTVEKPWYRWGNRTRFGASTNTGASSMSLLSSCTSPFSTSYNSFAYRANHSLTVHEYQIFPLPQKISCCQFVSLHSLCSCKRKTRTASDCKTSFHSFTQWNCRIVNHHARASPACRFMPQLANYIFWVRVFSKMRGMHCRSHTPDNTKLQNRGWGPGARVSIWYGPHQNFRYRS